MENVLKWFTVKRKKTNKKKKQKFKEGSVMWMSTKNTFKNEVNAFKLFYQYTFLQLFVFCGVKCDKFIMYTS